MEDIDNFIGDDIPIVQSKEEILKNRNKYAKKYFKKYRKSNEERYLRNYFSVKKSNSKRKNIVWDLDIEWFLTEYKKGCALTNIPFYIDLDNKIKGSYSPYQVSIDRIIPDKGYLKNNSRLILYSLNMFKSKWTDDIIYEIASQLIDFRNQSL
jgi:hypothetical protein